MLRYTLLATRESGPGFAFDVAIPAESRYFEGHFPGRPVLPAIAQIDLVSRLVRAVLEDGGRPAGVPSLRLLRPIGPGARIAVELSRPDSTGRLAFSLSESGVPAAAGTLRWSPE